MFSIHSLLSLHDASRIGKLEIIANYISEGVDLNAKDHNGKPPLIIAAFFGHVEAVHMLLLAGADVNAVDERGVNALMWAAAGGYSRTMQCLIDHGINIDQTDPEGQTALIWAAKHSQKQSIRFLLAHGANVNLRDDNGSNALIWPAGSGKLAIIKQLIAAGIKVDASSDRVYERETPLLIAIKKGHTAIVQYLIECGAKINVGFMPPIVYARHIKTAKVLLDAGANIDATNWDNVSALDRAIMSENKDMVAFLLSRGAKVRKYSLRLASYYPDVDIFSMLFTANPEKCNRHKDFMLGHVANDGHQPIVAILLASVAFLLAKGANINNTVIVPFDIEMTILQCAAASGKKALVEMLLERGADSDLPNRLDRPLLFAAEDPYGLYIEGHNEVVALLLERGGNVNARNQYGETALMKAVPSFNGMVPHDYREIPKYKVFKTLLAHGAMIDSEDYKKKKQDGSSWMYPRVIPWLTRECAWHRRRHAICFYARRHHIAETAISADLSAK